jgi:HlyD family secretion protein
MGFIPLIQIPDLSQMQVRLTLNESNFKRLEKKQKVTIQIDAMPGVEMTGLIKTKEPMGKPIEKDSKVKVFGVIASIDSLVGGLRPGISATCNVIIKQVDDTLLVPYLSVFDKDSLKVAYVANDGFFEQRNVSLAMHNHKMGIIQSGLKQDEFVSMIKPPERLIKNLN